jgi:NADPH2:quinone reductase
MRAVGVSAFGGPEALTVHDLPDPHPGAGEVRIRVRAAAVSPTDAGVRSGGYDVGDLQPPYSTGLDAAGVIDEVGAGSTWQVGDEVMAIALPRKRHGGAYVEYLVAPDDSIAPIPAGTLLEEASTVPMNGLTATQILELMNLQPGQTVAVIGSAGTLGNYRCSSPSGRDSSSSLTRHPKMFSWSLRSGRTTSSSVERTSPTVSGPSSLREWTASSTQH